MSGNVEEVASVIKDLVRADGQVTGSRLAHALKARVPEWNPAAFGVRSLREFIAAHVAGVVIAHRSGMDVVYGMEGISAPTAPNENPQLSPEIDVWRVWVSPNSPHALAVDRTGAGVHAVPRKSRVADDQLLVEPVGTDAHREIAKSFLERVPAALNAKLLAVVDSPSAAWWQAWLRELRGTEQMSDWNAFRRLQLEDRLATRLRENGLAQSAIEGVLKLVREKRADAMPRPRKDADRDNSAAGDAAALRRLILRAVQHMNASELRDLRLPLGVVLDAIAPLKPR